MIENQEDELSDEERGALRSLKSERLPPPGMEERVVAHLRKRGLLRSGPGRRWLQVAAGLAACLGLFFAGVEIGARRSSVPSQPVLSQPVPAQPIPSQPVSSQPAPQPIASQPVPSQPAGERFILLLYESAAYVHATPGSERDRIAEYSAWARDLSQSGEFVTGEKLKDGEELLGARAQPVARDQPGSLGGFFIIAARDPEEARRIASTCPHLRHGGWIVIMQIDRT